MILRKLHEICSNSHAICEMAANLTSLPFSLFVVGSRVQNIVLKASCQFVSVMCTCGTLAYD